MNTVFYLQPFLGWTLKPAPSCVLLVSLLFGLTCFCVPALSQTATQLTTIRQSQTVDSGMTINQGPQTVDKAIVTTLCQQQTGHCFDAQINDQEVIEIKDPAHRKMLWQQARQSNPTVPEFFWLVPKPIKGEFVFYITKQAKDFAQSVLGDEVEEEDVDVFPLQQQEISTELQNNKNLLNEPTLPRGRYVMHLQYIGRFGKDQKLVWIEVE